MTTTEDLTMTTPDAELPDAVCGNCAHADTDTADAGFYAVCRASGGDLEHYLRTGETRFLQVQAGDTCTDFVDR